MTLTAELKNAGFSRTRTIGSTVWVLCGTEGFWYPIRGGTVDTSHRIGRSDHNCNIWCISINNELRDDASSFKRLAARWG